MDAAINSSALELDCDQVKEQFPPQDGCLYLNSGSCGRKPQSVLRALSQGWHDLNINPTYTTFIDESALMQAKEAASRLFDVPARQLLLVQNTTQGLHLLMNSFLLGRGDELVTTDSEHGSVNVIAQFLAESRGIVVHKVHVDPLEGIEVFNRKLIEKLNRNTKLVLVSEISSYTGWRPNLDDLVSATNERNIPLLVDGAHAPGQIVCRPGKYRLWVGSGHKWLGGPNGTGFVYVAPDLVHLLQPVWLGDEYFKRKEAEANDLTRFESQGTSDVVRWRGLAAAIDLQLRLGSEKIYQRELTLVRYLRNAIAGLKPTVRTADQSPNTGMLCMHWNKAQIPVAHLRDHLWQKHKMWLQPDFINSNPGLGVRVSCHYSMSERDLDQFVDIMTELIIDE